MPDFTDRGRNTRSSIEHLVTEGTVDERYPTGQSEKRIIHRNAMIEAVKARIGGMTDDGRSNDEGI